MTARGLGKKMADKKLPAYNTAIANMLKWPSEVEMRFPKVGMRFYPLRADINKLQKLCDDYLNFIHEREDRPPYYFKPAAPFVLMQTVNYDRLEIEKVGWLKQHEAIFSVPLEWYERVEGKWVFKDWAMTYPFIYLDHPISIWMGREMYGWPKVPIRIARQFPLVNPPDPQGRVDFNLATHSAKRPNQPEPFRPFIEVHQDADGISPWSASDLCYAVPRAISGTLAAASTAVDAFYDFFLRPSAKDQAGMLPAMATTSVGYMAKWLPEFWTMMVPGLSSRVNNSIPTPEKKAPGEHDSIPSEGPHSPASTSALGLQNFTPSPFMRNNIVLKQFRDANDIGSACYQALVKSEISVDEILDAGLLFNPLSGDTTGGVTVRLHQNKNQPVVETLGLITSSITSDNHGTDIVSLKPFCPFWWTLNLGYGDATTLSWRSRTTSFANPEKLGGAADGRNDYVVVGSGAREEIAGVLRFPDCLMRVLPLKANPAVLKVLCDELFADTPYSFEDLEPYVLMIADQFAGMEADTDPLQHWADSELMFAVVAKFKKEDSSNLRQTIVPLIGFSGSGWNAISHREVNGRFTLASDFVDAKEYGMQEMPPIEKVAVRKLFSLRTSICPTLNDDEQTKRWTLIDLGEDTSEPKKPKESPESIGAWLDELGLGTIAQKHSYESIALKQFRDASDSNSACYQAIVALERKYTHKPTIEWIHERLKITIHQFETMQIATRFGLLGGDKKVDRFGRDCMVFEPIKPFWVRGEMVQGLGRNLCWRAGVMDWQYDEVK
jgi:hypothetical protein